jgi:SAM-dependent methyltransferase
MRFSELNPWHWFKPRHDAPFYCPHCRKPISFPLREGEVCPHATVSEGVLCMGSGYDEAIVAVHEGNVAPDTIAARRAFDERYAVYSAAAHAEFSAAGGRSLSLGCGAGLDVLEFLKLGYDAYGFEVVSMLPIWKKQLGAEAWRCVVGVRDDPLPFEDGAFDLISSVNVLEHVGTEPPQEYVSERTIEARKSLITEAVRTLRPGGLFVLTCPNRAYPFDCGHAHHYIPDTYKMMAERGFTFTDPFHPMNFLPSVQDITNICRAINRTVPIQLWFLTDRYLFGLDGPEFHDAALREHLRSVNRSWRALTSESFWSCRNPHIHAFIIRETVQRPALFDITGEWWVRSQAGSDDVRIGRWHRQALLPSLAAQWQHQGTGYIEGDILDVVEREASLVILRSRASGTIFKCVAENGSRLNVTADPSGATFLARRGGRSLTRAC